MPRQPKQLVEAIFDRLKARGDKPARVSSLFHAPRQPSSPDAPKPARSRRTPTTAKIQTRFPLGLDIGATSVKWVQLGMVKDTPSVVGLGCELLELAEQLPDAERASAAARRLRQLAVQHRLAGPVAVSLPLEDVTLHLFKLPMLAEAELRDALHWQLEQTLPAHVKFEDVVMDFIPLEGLGREQEIQVLTTTVTKAKVMARAELVRQAGLEPVAVDLDPCALAACLLWPGHVRPDETILVLHLEMQRAFMAVVAKSQLAFSQALLVTGSGLTRAIADALRVSYEEAERLKVAHGVSAENRPAAAGSEPVGDDTAGQVARALASPLENLMVDVLHSFKGFSYQVSQSQVTSFNRVLLSGGSSGLPGLAAYLEGRFGVPVSVADPLGTLPVLDETVSPADRAAFGPRLGIALGLAIRDVTP